MRQIWTAIGIASAVSLGLAGCGGGGDGGSNNSSSATTTTSTPQASGQMTLALTDAPVDGVSAINLTVTGVELKPADGPAKAFSFDKPKEVNLLDLQHGDVLGLLNDAEVPAGDYNWLRLMLDTSALSIQVSNTGGVQPLTVPSGAETGLKVVNGFTVPAGEKVSYALDFDARKSLVQDARGYKLKPTLRLVDLEQAHSLSGTVDFSHYQQARTCARTMPANYYGVIYLYEGNGATIDDLGSDHEPVASAPVVQDTSARTGYSYQTAALPEGNYSIAYTCSVDDPAVNEDLTFDDGGSVTLNTDGTVIDFPIVLAP